MSQDIVNTSRGFIPRLLSFSGGFAAGPAEFYADAMHEDKELTSWDGFGRAVDSLTALIERSDFDPTCILAVTRGGLVVGGALAYRLNLKNVQTVNVEYYAGSGLDDVQLSEPRILPPGFDLTHLRGERVLIVDDVADSGTTLTFLEGLISFEVAECRSAVWFAKPSSKVRPDYAAERTDKWIVFPWSPHATTA